MINDTQEGRDQTVAFMKRSGLYSPMHSADDMIAAHIIYHRAKLEQDEAFAECVKALEAVEWSASRRGQGSGTMGSGGDGRSATACPSCGGIDPSCEASRGFIKSAHGHRKNCKLSAALANARKVTA